MRFSVRLLLFIIFLIGVVFAASLSERPGRRYSRVASVDFSPSGEELAVNVLEYNGSITQERMIFDRTISIVDFPAQKSKRIVQRDRQEGGNLENFVFWNSQSDVLHTEAHLFFLNRDRRSVMIKHLETGEFSEWARFTDGMIFSFGASSDARLIVAQGEVSPRWPDGEEIIIDGETYIAPAGKPTLELIKKEDDLFYTGGLVSNLGISEPEMITFPFPATDAVVGGEGAAGSDAGADKVEEWQVYRPRELWLSPPPSIEMVKAGYYRVTIVPGVEFDPNDSDAIGLITGAFSIELDADTQEPVGSANTTPPSFRWKDSIFDFAASQGACRFAKLLRDNQLLLNIATDRFDGLTDNVNLRLRWKTNPGSVVALSKTGELVAGSNNKQIQILNTSNLVSANAIEIAELMPRFGRVDVDQETQVLKHNAMVTAMAFSPGEKYLIVGDDNGDLSTYEIASGNLVNQIRAPRKTRGLPVHVVILLSAVCLTIAAEMFITWWYSRRTQNNSEINTGIP